MAAHMPDLEGVAQEDRRALLAAGDHNDEAAAAVAAPAGRPRSIGRAVAAAVLAAAAAATALATTRLGGRDGGAARVGGAVIPETKAEESPKAVAPEEAQRRYDARTKLRIETDLGALVTASDLPSAATPGGERSVKAAAEQLFEHVVASGLHEELTTEEVVAFKERFVRMMVAEAKEEDAHRGEHTSNLDYVKKAQAVLQRAKPAGTAALARSLNEAGLGFTAEMRPWMAHESYENFQSRLGRLPFTPEMIEKAEEASRKRPKSPRDPLPVEFDARTEWPECASVICNILDQGHCGSCWAFAAVAVADSRLCIRTRHHDPATGKMFGANPDVDMLSRGQAASCASEGNGCSGAWEFNAFEYIDNANGLVSTRCSPYFASGAGVEHFDSSMGAPGCPTECHYRYPRDMASDYVKPAGLGNYRLELNLQTRNDKLEILDDFRRELLKGPVCFGIFASQDFMMYSDGIYDLNCGVDGTVHPANHAVHAIGFGAGFFECQNSWGPGWGNEGHFRIAPCVATDFTVPGDIIPHEFEALPFCTTLDPPTTTTPPQLPPGSEQPCVVHQDGCITSPNYPGIYPANVECDIPWTFGKIKVVDFNTEFRYDYFEVNKQRFSGDYSGDATSCPLNDVVPETNIMWTSDFSNDQKGWKICPDV